MAIMHASFSYLSRSGGGSVASHAAYIAASIVKDERMGQSWDYSKKAPEILATGILAPEGAPTWAYDPDKLWNRVEEYEDYVAHNRFKGHKDPHKNTKSLRARESFLSSCKTGYKLTFALPLEITNKDHLKELAHKVVKECYVDHGLIAQYAIHDMKGNPHLHILSTTRPFIEGEFTKRYVLEKPQLKEKRAHLADICNQFGLTKGYDYYIDARSYEDQGLKIIPTKHIGPNAHHRLQAKSQNALANEEIRQKNIEIFLNHPEEIIKVVASQKAVFTQVDLAKEIFKRVAGDEKLYAVLKAKVEGIDLPKAAIIGKTLNDNPLYESKSLQCDILDYSRTIDRFTAQLLSRNQAIYLGENVKGQTFYTSFEMKELETKIRNTLEALLQRSIKPPAEKDKIKSIKKVQKQERLIFTEEQRGAIDHLLSDQAISVLTGKAGTGKSTVLKPVVDAYKRIGMTVIGVAFQGKVADQLSYELGVEGYTLDQLDKKWSKQDSLKRLIENKELKGQALAKAKTEVNRLEEWRFTRKHVVILDEGSMVSGSLWKSLLTEVERSGARLRIVQDNKQIKALYGLDAARLVEEKIGAYEIQGVVRQREDWMREASALLNEHRIEEGLKPYDDKGHFDYRETDYGAKISLVADYLEGLEKNPHQTHMAIAQKNKDVIELNELIRGALRSQGKLGAQEFVFGKEGQGIFKAEQGISSPQSQHFRKSAHGWRFAVGDRVMFLSNDHKGWHVKTLEKGKSEKQGVKNGTLGVIESFDLKRQTVEVRLPDGRLVGFDSKGYDAITHGYAVTINKSQGATFDHSYGLFSSFNANQLLIWLTRHKESFRGYVSKGIASDLKGMVSHVARADYKGLSTDYDLTDHQKPYFNLVQQYWKVSQEAGNLRTQIESITLQAEKSRKEASLSQEWEQYHTLVQERNQKAEDILKEWPQCSPFIQQTGVRRETLEVQAGLKQRLLSSAEEAALEKIEVYFKVADQARHFWKDISQTHPGSLSYDHPEYKDYAKVKEIRNELAYEIASFPQMYKPFFKLKEQGKSYVTYSGTLYEQRPHSFKAVHAQAEQYIAFKRTERYESTLTFHERATYKQVQDYRAFYHISVAAYKQIPELEKMAGSPSVIEAHQQKMKEFASHRDKLAYDLLSNYDQAHPFIEKLGLKEEALLKHAVFGEVKGIVEAYKTADTLEAKVQMADKLVSFIFKEEGGVDKALYSLLKEEKLDFQRLKFEQGWHKAHQEGKELSINTLQELENAYKDLSTFRENKQVQDKWNILKVNPSELGHNLHEQPYNYRLEREKSSQQVDLTRKKIANAYDREQVLACLTSSHIEGIFARHIDHWVATPKSYIRPQEIRYGQYKEFWINRNTGAWYNFAAGEGGDIFKYISKSQGIRYGEAIKHLGTELNAPQITSINWEEREKRQTELRLQAELEEKAKIEKSQANTKKLYETSRPILGTLAERYLREHRHIKTAELAQDLRFIAEYKDYASKKSYPALAAFARDAKGKLTAAQITCLDPQTANKADIDVKKRSLGSIKNTTVEIQQGDGSTYITEGVETALSLKEAGVNGRILVSLGLSNMRNVGSHIKDKDQPVILCCDADELGSPAWKSSEQNLKKLQDEGFKASIIRPQGEKGRDFNDILQEEGIAAVQWALKDVALFKERLSQKETLFSQHTSIHSSETEVISPQLDKASNAQKEIKQRASSQEEAPNYGLNALELYLNCKEKLKTLPSIMKAQGEDKVQVKRLNKETHYHAHLIWEDKDLKQQAFNLGIEAEIKKKAEIHHYDIAWDAHSKKTQEGVFTDPQENALDLYLNCEIKLKNLPSIVVAKGQEKDEVRALLQQARTHAYAIWQDPSLKTKAQELGLEKAIKHHAQIHKQEIEQTVKRGHIFKF